MAKYLISILAVGSVLLIGVSIDTQSHPVAARGPSGEGPEMIYASGRVEGAGEEIELRTLLRGRVESLLVDECSPVASGDVLMALDDRQYQHEVALAQAELAMAEAKLQRLINGARAEERREAKALLQAKQADLERARLNWNRVRQLRAQNAVTEQEADDLRTEVSGLEAAVDAATARRELLDAPARPDEVQLAQAAVAAAQAKLQAAQLQLQRTQLVAPCDALVLAVNTDRGELTGPDSLTPAIVLADTSRYRVRAFVEEYDAPRVRIGMAARVTADGMPGKQLSGTVTQMSPRMDRKYHFSDAPDEQFDTKTREVWIDLTSDQAANLVLGLRVDVELDPS